MDSGPGFLSKMEISITHQQMEAAISLVIGFGTGIVYDFFGVLRRRFILKIFTYLFDLLFCLLLGCVYFLVGYGPGGGRLRLFMLAFILLGCVLYFLLLSKFMNRLLELFVQISLVSSSNVCYALQMGLYCGEKNKRNYEKYLPLFIKMVYYI